jgi:tripeptide aminopeptidase
MKQRIAAWNKRFDWGLLTPYNQWLINQAITIQQIPAPTFGEARRASYVAKQFSELGLSQIEIDELSNVRGLLEGKNHQLPGVMISAHTDTVFGAETILDIQQRDGLIYGPGIGDNSMGVAGLLGIAAILKSLNIQPESDLWFVANTREEGLGDLGGMKAVFQHLKHQIGCVINLEGMAFGHVYHTGIAVRRLHIRAKGEGGHSWLNFGRSSAIHGIMELGAKIVALMPPATPRTTYNIGIVEGGQSINTIAAEAGLWLDLRSEQSNTLEQFEQDVRDLVNGITRPHLAFQIEVVGDRPAGSIPVHHPLVEGALSALEAVGIKGTLENGSTDANVPLAAGCPAVTVGVTRGGNAHRLDEYIETRPIADGLRHLLLLTLAASDTAK